MQKPETTSNRRFKQPSSQYMEAATMMSPYPTVAIVKDVKDYQHMGRIRAWVPSMGGDENDESYWKWFRQMHDYVGQSPASPEQVGTEWPNTPVSYGETKPPPDPGNRVVVMFLDGDTNQGVYFGGLPQLGMNHSLPDNACGKVKGENGPEQPVTEYSKKETNVSNPLKPPDGRVKHEFQAKVLEKAGLALDPIRGMSCSSAQRETPSSVWGIKTAGPVDDEATGPYPIRHGGHSFIMDDGAADGSSELVRIRTRNGAQVLLHDSAGLIYICNQDATGWIEIDNTGRISVFGNDDVSVRAGGDLNLDADNDVNIGAGRDVNVLAGGNTKWTTKGDHDIDVDGDYRESTGGDRNMTATGNLALKTDTIFSARALHAATIWSEKTLGLRGKNTFVNAAKKLALESDKQVMVQAGSDVNVKSTVNINMKSNLLTNISGRLVNLNPLIDAPVFLNPLATRKSVVADPINPRVAKRVAVHVHADPGSPTAPGSGYRKTPSPVFPTREPWSQHQTFAGGPTYTNSDAGGAPITEATVAEAREAGAPIGFGRDIRNTGRVSEGSAGFGVEGVDGPGSDSLIISEDEFVAGGRGTASLTTAFQDKVGDMFIKAPALFEDGTTKYARVGVSVTGRPLVKPIGTAYDSDAIAKYNDRIHRITVSTRAKDPLGLVEEEINAALARLYDCMKQIIDAAIKAVTDIARIDVLIPTGVVASIEGFIRVGFGDLFKNARCTLGNLIALVIDILKGDADPAEILNLGRELLSIPQQLVDAFATIDEIIACIRQELNAYGVTLSVEPILEKLTEVHDAMLAMVQEEAVRLPGRIGEALLDNAPGYIASLLLPFLPFFDNKIDARCVDIRPLPFVCDNARVLALGGAPALGPPARTEEQIARLKPAQISLSARGLKFLEKHEGYRPYIYDDEVLNKPYNWSNPVGKPTIGIGHLLTPEERERRQIRIGDRWVTPPFTDKSMAYALLHQDLERFVKVVKENTGGHTLSTNQSDALIAFAFNVGVGNYLSDDNSVRKRVMAGKFDEVPARLMLWVNSNGKVNDGLVNRRRAEGELFSEPSPEIA